MKPNRRGFLSSLVAVPPAVAIAAASPMPRVEKAPSILGNIGGRPAPVPPLTFSELQPYFDGMKKAYIEREHAKQRLEVLTLFAASKVNAALAGAFDLPIDYPANISADVCDNEEWIVFTDSDSPGQRFSEYWLPGNTDVYTSAAKMIALSCTLQITPEQLNNPETFVDQIHTEGLIESLRSRTRAGCKPLFIVSRGFRDFIPAADHITAVASAPLLIMRGVLSYDLQRLAQVVTFEATLGLALPKPEPKPALLGFLAGPGLGRRVPISYWPEDEWT